MLDTKASSANETQEKLCRNVSFVIREIIHHILTL